MSEDLSTLAGTQEVVWDRLTAAMRDPSAPARVLALATVDTAGGASVRNVVLRAVDRTTGRIALYSHIEAQKVADLRSEPACEAAIWDATARLQIRLRGLADVQDGPSAIWDGMSDADRALYGATPGIEIEEPSDASLFGEEPDPSAFTLIQITLSTIETLHLTRPEHRRARFVRTDAGWESFWLSP